MTLRELMADDVLNVLLNEDEFAETIVYTALGDAPISVKAIVERNPPEPIGNPPKMVAGRMVITVANDALLGISSATINVGGDTVTLAPRIGATDKTMPIHRLLEDSGGVTRFEVR